MGDRRDPKDEESLERADATKAPDEATERAVRARRQDTSTQERAPADPDEVTLDTVAAGLKTRASVGQRFDASLSGFRQSVKSRLAHDPDSARERALKGWQSFQSAPRTKRHEFMRAVDTFHRTITPRLRGGSQRRGPRPMLRDFAASLDTSPWVEKRFNRALLATQASLASRSLAPGIHSLDTFHASMSSSQAVSARLDHALRTFHSGPTDRVSPRSVAASTLGLGASQGAMARLDGAAVQFRRTAESRSLAEEPKSRLLELGTEAQGDALQDAVDLLHANAAASQAALEDETAVASKGMEGPSQQLPHLDTLQPLFGPHDLSGVKAYTGGSAKSTNEELGAVGYATHESVVLAQTDLFTVAHEAAHVVQQRLGVVPAGHQGQSGDTHERHADQVAEKVVRGESVETLLDPTSKAGGGQPPMDKWELARRDCDYQSALTKLLHEHSGAKRAAVEAELEACRWRTERNYRTEGFARLKTGLQPAAAPEVAASRVQEVSSAPRRATSGLQTVQLKADADGAQRVADEVAAGLAIPAPVVRTDKAAAQRVDAWGVRAAMDDGEVLLGSKAPPADSPDGRELIAHEVVHVAQRLVGQFESSPSAAEHEAHGLARWARHGRTVPRPAIRLTERTAFEDKKKGKGNKETPSQEIEFSEDESRVTLNGYAWVGSARNPKLKVGREWLMKRLNKETLETSLVFPAGKAATTKLLRPLLQTGRTQIFTWATKKAMNKAAATLGLTIDKIGPKTDIFRCTIDIPQLLQIIGPPPQAPLQVRLSATPPFKSLAALKYVYFDVMVAKTGAFPAEALPKAENDMISNGALVARLNSFIAHRVGDSMRRPPVSYVAHSVVASDTSPVIMFRIKVGDVAGAFGGIGRLIQLLNSGRGSDDQIQLPGAQLTLPKELSKKERKFATSIIKNIFAAIPKSDPKDPLIYQNRVTLSDVAALYRLDGHPRSRELMDVLSLLLRSGQVSAAMPLAELVERAEAQLAHRDLLMQTGGETEGMPSAGGGERKHPQRVPARIVNRSGILVPGETAKFDALIEAGGVDGPPWPVVDVEWRIVPVDRETGRRSADRTSVVLRAVRFRDIPEARGKTLPHLQYEFLAAGDYEIWASVDHEHYLVNTLKTHVRVQTQQAWLDEARQGLLGEWAEKFGATKDFDFGHVLYGEGKEGTGTLTDAVFKTSAKDLSRAELFKLRDQLRFAMKRTKDSRLKRRFQELINQTEKQIAAIGADGKDGYRHVHCTGHFVSKKGTSARLNLAMTVRQKYNGLWEGKLRDYSRVAEPKLLTFTGWGRPYKAMVHDLFDEITHAYPNGYLDLNTQKLVDGEPSKEFIFFRRKTDTLGKDMGKVFDTAAQVVVTTGGILLTMFPATMKVGISVLLSYQGLDLMKRIADDSAKGTLEWDNTGLELAMFTFDIIPAFRAGRRLLRGGRLLAVDIAQGGGDTFLMTTDAWHQAQLWEQGKLVALSAKIRELMEASRNPAYPKEKLAALKEKVDGLKEEALALGNEFIKKLAGSSAISKGTRGFARIPKHLATKKLQAIENATSPQGPARKGALDGVTDDAAAQQKVDAAVGPTPVQVVRGGGKKVKVKGDGSGLRVEVPEGKLTTRQAEKLAKKLAKAKAKKPKKAADGEPTKAVREAHKAAGVEAELHDRAVADLSAADRGRLMVVYEHASKKRHDDAEIGFGELRQRLDPEVADALAGKLRALKQKQSKAKPKTASVTLNGDQHTLKAKQKIGEAEVQLELCSDCQPLDRTLDWVLNHPDLKALGKSDKRRATRVRRELRKLFKEANQLSASMKATAKMPEGSPARKARTELDERNFRSLAKKIQTLGDRHKGVKCLADLPKAMRAAQADNFDVLTKGSNPWVGRQVDTANPPPGYDYRRVGGDLRIVRKVGDDATHAKLTVETRNGKQYIALARADAGYAQNVVKAGSTLDSLYADLTRPRGTFRTYAKMLAKLQIGPQDIKSRLKNLVGDRMVDGKTTKGLMLDDIRRELRKTFEGEVRKAMRLGHPAGKVPESARADSHKKMRELTSGLSGNDKGRLTEQWYKDVFAPSGKEQVAIDRGEMAKQGVNIEGNRRLDLLVKQNRLRTGERGTLHEVKSGDGEFSDHDLKQFDDFMTLVHSEPSPIVDGVPLKQAVYTLTSPEGAAKNAAWLRVQLNRYPKFSVRVFDASGKPHVFSGENLAAFNQMFGV